MKSKPVQFSAWHVGVAADAIAAGLFARCGLDVSMQYGANQPEYDLPVVAERLRQTAKGRGDTVLYERKAWTGKAWAAGTVDEIPASWRFSEERVNHFLSGIGTSYGGGSA